VKENQPILYEEIKEHFERLDGPENHREMPEDIRESELEKDRGRIERRRVRACRDIDFLTGGKQWKDIKTIIECRRERTVKEKTAVTYRYYISSKDTTADEFGRIIRNHRSRITCIGYFGEDRCQARKDNPPKNLTVLRKIALGRLRAADAGKGVSIRRKMFMSGLSHDFLQKVLF